MTFHETTAPVGTVSPRALREWLVDGEEIALVDVREEGQFGLGHPLLSSNIPYSRIEVDIAAKVPLLATRLVLLDAGDGVAAKAARRLLALGYGRITLLEGGAPGWTAAGYELFDGLNVPSKAFAEVVEVEQGTPHIEASELEKLTRSGADLVILDTRTPEEFDRFHVPGALSAPGVELIARAAELASSPDTLIVVSCAGRTRSIIGAQALINFGTPNRVVSLAGGTQGWRLAGFELEHGAVADASTGSVALPGRLARAAELRSRYGLAVVSPTDLQAWRSDGSRTTFLFDVRTREEFERGHLPGARWVPGGQLVQTLDDWVAVRHARLVVADDDGVRASVAAHWLKQMGWDVFVCTADAGAHVPHTAWSYQPKQDRRIAGEQAASWVGAEGKVVSSDRSAVFLAGHVRESQWVNRARVGSLAADIRSAPRILVVGADPALSDLVADDLAEATGAEVRILDATVWEAKAAGFQIDEGGLSQADRIDTLFWNHLRHEGDKTAMRAYLDWEIELPARVAADGGAGFQIRA
jgi:rhodanese-related sulfurtransferase